MAKNTPKNQTQPENEDEALAQNPNSPEQAQQQQDAENAALQAENHAKRPAPKHRSDERGRR